MDNNFTLKELFACACKNAQRIFNLDHSVSPIWHVIAGDGENMLICTPWTCDAEKDGALFALREMFKERDVQRFAFVHEAWTVHLNPEESKTMTAAGEYTGPRPSAHPDRREVLRVTAEDRDGTVLSGQWFILRPEHGPPTLSPFHQDNYDMQAGRMTGLLRPEKGRQH